MDFRNEGDLHSSSHLLVITGNEGQHKALKPLVGPMEVASIQSWALSFHMKAERLGKLPLTLNHTLRFADEPLAMFSKPPSTWRIASGLQPCSGLLLLPFQTRTAIRALFQTLTPSRQTAVPPPAPAPSRVSR